ncbi:TPA: calcium/proton exchanger [Candidatus Saccharibacteria bacterium]|nr:MAG: putative H+/Ca2+ exchanging protein [Candidatus Saccharibacteria bacterium GW2011_GWA2_46_10]OGL36275.1 MAG: calcium/proton exchanger [Candidatus Saccharibacteria bacterium RIFCSPHIGHO2_12_FULL_47_17]HCM51927.1 calcium/proton exchanger [Candidatus Saccharibacteria bacterium]
MQRFFLGSLAIVPVAILGNYLHWSYTTVFFLAALAIIPLAKFLGEATEEIASRSGPALGGLLNATFGNATELIIAGLALNAGLIELVKASITGSIIGNLLLVLGASIFLGGLKHNKQVFNRTAAQASGAILLLGVIALTIPQIFLLTSPAANAIHSKDLSVLVAIIMFVIYLAFLFFIFRTHKHLYTEELGHESRWSTKKSITVLLASTAGVGWISEILVESIEPALHNLGWTELFVGAVIIAIIGNAAEHASAVVMAVKNRMDLSLQIAIGSATQIAMFVVPLLVFAGLLLGQSMDLIFTTFELATIIVSVMIANIVIQDGESNWFEGAQLLSAYAIIAVGFFLYAA